MRITRGCELGSSTHPPPLELSDSLQDRKTLIKQKGNMVRSYMSVLVRHSADPGIDPPLAAVSKDPIRNESFGNATY